MRRLPTWRTEDWTGTLAIAALAWVPLWGALFVAATRLWPSIATPLLWIMFAPFAVGIAIVAVAIIAIGLAARPPWVRIAYLGFVLLSVVIKDDPLVARDWWIAGAVCGGFLLYWLAFDALHPMLVRTTWWQRRTRKRGSPRNERLGP